MTVCVLASAFCIVYLSLSLSVSPLLSLCTFLIVSFSTLLLSFFTRIDTRSSNVFHSVAFPVCFFRIYENIVVLLLFYSRCSCSSLKDCLAAVVLWVLPRVLGVSAIERIEFIESTAYVERNQPYCRVQRTGRAVCSFFSSCSFSSTPPSSALPTRLSHFVSPSRPTTITKIP